MRKHIVSGLIAILLIINLGGCSNMTNTQSANNVIAGAIPNEITADLMVDWFNTKADENDCKLKVPLMILAELFLEEVRRPGAPRAEQLCRYWRYQ